MNATVYRMLEIGIRDRIGDAGRAGFDQARKFASAG